MEIELSVIGPAGHEDEVVLTAPAGTAVGQIAEHLIRSAAGEPASELCWADGRPVAASLRVGVAPVLRGIRVFVGPWPVPHGVDGPASEPWRRGRARCGPEPPTAPGLRLLRIVGGPAAGGVYPLVDAETCVGRGVSADVRLADSELSRRHSVIEVRADGVWVRDAGSANGTWLDGVEVGAEPVPFPPDAVLRCGSSLLSYAIPAEPPAVVRVDGTGGIELHRPPRLRPRRAVVEVVFPEAPPGRPPIRFPWVLVVAPLVLGCVLWLVTDGNSAYLLFTLLSPLMLVANTFGDRVSGRREHRRAIAEHAEEIARCSAERAAELASETTQRREESPDPAALTLTAGGWRSAGRPGARLWERRRSDEDALVLRVGTADLPARLTVRGDGPTRPRLRHVPVTVPLREVGVLGLAGRDSVRHGLARWLVGQLAAQHSPRDLRLVLLTDDRDADWRWMRWLPQVLPREGERCRALIGVGQDQIDARVAELIALIEGRLRSDAGEVGRAGSQVARAGDGRSSPFVVVVVDGAGRLRAAPGVARLLADGPTVGVFALCLADDALELPEECGATAVLTTEHGSALVVAVGSEPALAEVTADLVPVEWADRLARALAPIRDATPGHAEARLPSRVRLLELLPDVEPAAVAARWRRAPRSPRALLGIGIDGQVSVDLQLDGPHALVAGTTGAGKSELLQTLIASLAVANRPDELTFILVDYKGGAAFAGCARLPHAAAMVTDLDTTLTARALASLSAEVRRREQLLARADAKDLEAYQSACDGEREPPTAAARLARLVIVVDEFAALAAELPDFVAGLVDIARRGRSLGVHLVLATQRPAGVVSAEIRANTALRICLRVTDPTESVDVLDAPDAARIGRAMPGRAYARLASGGLTAVQTAWVGGHPPLPAREEPAVEVVPWETLGDPPPDVAQAVDEREPVDLDRLVGVLGAAAELAGVVTPASPWLPPLPQLVTVADLPGVPTAPDRIPLGLHDLPAEQRRAVYALDLAVDGHLMIVGGPRSGRTSALRTIAAGIGRRPVADTHLYALDCGGGGLAVLDALPQCGAVVPRDDVSRGQRLLARLDIELAARREVLMSGGFGSVAEQRAAAARDMRLPWLVLLVDSWEGFVDAYDGVDHGRIVEQFVRLVREGPAAGLRIVLAGDRGLLTARAATLIAERLILRMPDPDSYRIAGISPGAVPVHIPPGRALLCGRDAGAHDRRDSRGAATGPNASTEVTEVQLALLAGDPSGPAQLAAIARLVAARGDPGASPGQAGEIGLRRRPIRLGPLPTRVTIGDLSGDAETEKLPLWTPLGIGGDQPSTIGLDLGADGPGVLVAGPPGSGRSTALRTAAVHHLVRGNSVALVGARRSSLDELAGVPGVLGWFGADDGDALRKVVADAVGPVVIVVDDADQLLDSEVDAAVAELLSRSQLPTLVAGATDELHSIHRGVTVAARRSRAGLLLCPAGPLDGELFGVRLSRGIANRPGRGVLVRRGGATPIQVAVSETVPTP